MSVKIKYLLSGFACLMSVALSAQTTGDRNVTVEREFQPVIQDAGKITSVPEILTMSVVKERADYSEFNQVLPFEKNFLILPAAEVLHLRRTVSNDAMVQIGVGNYWNTFANVALPILKTEKTRLDFNLNHVATFGKRQHSLTDGNFHFNQSFPTLELYAGMGLSHEFFNYYGDNFSGGNSPEVMDLNAFSQVLSIPSPTYKELNLESITRTAQDYKLTDLVGMAGNDVLWRYQAFAGLNTLPGADGLRHKLEMKYDMFNSRNGLQENLLTTSYGINTGLGNNRFGMDFELVNLFYQKNNMPAINFWDYYAVFTMNPYYLIEREDWFLRAGLKTSFSFIHGRPFNPMPDITAEWKVLPKHLSLYGGITGSYNISTLNSVYAENPYVYPDLRIKDQYTPIRSYFGLKVKAIHNMLIDAFIDYSFIKDQYFFVNKAYKTNDPGVHGDSTSIFTNRFNVIYSDAGLFRTGIRIGYNIRNLVNVQLKGVYNGWNVQSERFAWMKPAYEVDFSADLRVNKKITASLNVYYEGVKYARMGVNTSGIVIARRMNPITDINLGAAYAFNKTLSTFVRINNLLNNQYEHYYGYKVQGLNFLVGGTFAF